MPLSMIATLTPAPAFAAPPASSRPLRVDEREVRIVMGGRAVDLLELRASNHRGRAKRLQRRAVQRHADRVQRDVELVRDLGVRRVALSHCLNSLRVAASRARSDFTLALLKSIFLPLAGRVLADTDNGSPASWTSAESVLRSAPARRPRSPSHWRNLNGANQCSRAL